MHEAFLTRLASHPVFRKDHNFRVFLEYDQDLAVRSKNKIEMFEVSFVVLIVSRIVLTELITLYFDIHVLKYE